MHTWKVDSLREAEWEREGAAAMAKDAEASAAAIVDSSLACSCSEASKAELVVWFVMMLHNGWGWR